jgi:hypothetical protein
MASSHELWRMATSAPRSVTSAKLAARRASAASRLAGRGTGSSACVSVSFHEGSTVAAAPSAATAASKRSFASLAET